MPTTSLEPRSLVTPPPKAASRLQREVLTALAPTMGIDFFCVENRFQTIRSALVHLCHHTSFRSSTDELVKSLVEQTQVFLGREGVQNSYSRRWLTNLTRATESLRVEYQKMLDEQIIVWEDVLLYVRVIDLLQARYREEGYSVEGIADPFVYAQAQLIVANFPAYERTLNER